MLILYCVRFSERLLQIASVERREALQAEQGKAIRRPTKKRNLANSRRIVGANRSLEAGRSSLRQHLIAISYAIGGRNGHFGEIAAHVGAAGYAEPEVPIADGVVGLDRDLAGVEEIKCVICHTSRRTELALPCKHLMCCRACVTTNIRFGNQNCVSCRQPVREYMRIFL
jgi:hypothetical protein